MKVSLNWIREFTNVPLTNEQIVEKIGTQLGAVDEVVDLSLRYRGIIIARIVSCLKHPDADKLSICLIDDGGAYKDVARNAEGLIQVVCGAPNARDTLLVAWIPPGVVVPNTFDKDPFILESREIRGQISNGMIASPKELALGDNHSGILEIDDSVEPGKSFAEHFKLDDCIIDIENKMFTHRPDCFGILGVAREIAGITPQQFKSPDWYLSPDVSILTSSSNQTSAVNVANDAGELTPRLMAIPMSSIKVGPSPMWLQTKLARLGVRPINVVVDISNFVMLVSAQPIHIYDLDKLTSLSDSQATLKTRMSVSGEKLSLLGEKEITLDDDSIVIATNKQVIGLAGIMGGSLSEVDENTKNILIECATFDMNVIRKTSMKYGLFTDASTRFNKGQSPLQNQAALTYSVKLLSELAGGVVSGALADIKQTEVQPREVTTSSTFINSRLGINLSANESAELLKNVEFSVEVSNDQLKITAPFWRQDIEIPEDIVEEVGRLHGYDKLPTVLPARSLAPAQIDNMLSLKTKIRKSMASSGANEVLTYSFVHNSLLDIASQNQQQSFHIKNALSPSLQFYRQSLAPSLLEKVHPNIKIGFNELAIFEMGKGHIKKNQEATTIPKEMNILGFVYASSKKNASNGAAYFQAKNYLNNLALNTLNIAVDYEPLSPELDFAIAKPYEPARSALVKIKETGDIVGIVGEFKNTVLAKLKLPVQTAGFELDLDVLASAKPISSYLPLNKYPEISQDITLRVDSGLAYADLSNHLLEELGKLSDQQGYIHWLAPIDIFQKQDSRQTKNISFRIILSHPDKTLKTDEVNKIFDMLEVSVREKFNAERL